MNPSFGGAARYHNLTKPEFVLLSLLTTAQSLAQLAPYPVEVSLVAMYDNYAPEEQAAWAAVVSAMVRDTHAAGLSVNVTHVIVDADHHGNRGTNFLQYEMAAALLAAHVPGSNAQDAAAGQAASRRTLLYFLEDDYLHLPGAIPELVEVMAGPPLLGRRRTPEFVALYDHPDRVYRDDNRDFGRTELHGGRHRFWRTVESTTRTFAVSGTAFLRHYADITRDPPNDRETWYAIKDGHGWWGGGGTDLFSPLPTLTAHVVSAADAPPGACCMPYYVAWDAVLATAQRAACVFREAHPESPPPAEAFGSGWCTKVTGVMATRP